MNIKDCKWNIKTANGQKLMTAEILKKTPKMYETDGIKLENKIVTACFLNNVILNLFKERRL